MAHRIAIKSRETFPKQILYSTQILVKKSNCSHKNWNRNLQNSLFIKSKWQRRIIECHYENERIIYIKIKYNRGQLLVGAYSPEDGKKVETEDFYWNLQN